ncbi:Radical SAM protein OS=Streptomyces fumanus OX=67302 GN=GCM10018772_03810 PE=4 SV=1 [Streptomyces fumanus]
MLPAGHRGGQHDLAVQEGEHPPEVGGVERGRGAVRGRRGGAGVPPRGRHHLPEGLAGQPQLTVNAPTGTGSEAEYLEIALTEPRDPDRLRVLLDESMPAGLDIVDAVEARTPGLADRLTASVWELKLAGVDPADAERAVAAFNAAGSVEVQRRAKNGVRTFDARPAVAHLESVTPPSAAADRPSDQPCAILRLVVRHVTPAVRPDDVLSGLRAVADLAPPVPAAVTRLAQGLFDEETGTVTDPLAPDREAAQALSTADATAAATAPV